MDESPASAALVTDVCAAAAAPARTSAAVALEPSASPPHACAPESEAPTAAGLRHGHNTLNEQELVYTSLRYI